MKRLTDSRKKISALCLTALLGSISLPSIATAEEFGPLDYSIPWDWPNADEVANALFTARMIQEKRNGLLERPEAEGAANGSGGGGAGGICSQGSSQTIFNCVVNVSTTQNINSNLNNVTNSNTSTTSDASQQISDASNQLTTTP